MSDENTRSQLLLQYRLNIPQQRQFRSSIQCGSLRHYPQLTHRYTASSKNKTGGSLRRTLETANRCFSPPEIINPRSPTLVSYPSGRDAIVASISAFLAIATTSS